MMTGFWGLSEYITERDPGRVRDQAGGVVLDRVGGGMKFAVWLLLLVAPAVVFAKGGSVGIYAVIDQVVSLSPGTIRISGFFLVPVPMSSGAFKAPQRGYLEFKIPAGLEAETRKDWSALKAAAGTGRVVGFGEYWVANPNDAYGNPHRSLEVKVLTNGGGEPVWYPHPNRKGIVTNGDSDDPDFVKFAAQVRRAWQATAIR